MMCAVLLLKLKINTTDERYEKSMGRVDAKTSHLDVMRKRNIYLVFFYVSVV